MLSALSMGYPPVTAIRHFLGEMVMNYQEAKTDPGKADSTIVGEIVV